MFGLGKVRCLGCGQSVKMTRHTSYGGTSGKVCSRCLTPQGKTQPLPVSAGGPAQLIQVYTIYSTHGRLMKAFQQEAMALARAGWGVSNQTAAGNVYASFRWQPSSLSVTYQRLPEVPASTN